MRGQLSSETPVGAPASKVWAAYRGLELAKLVNELLLDVIGRVDVIEGDGGVGTIVKLTLPPGTPKIGFLKEKFLLMDDEKRIKETEIFEGYKELGFHLYRLRVEILEKDANSAIIRSIVEYDLDDKFASNITFASTSILETIADKVGNYLTKKDAGG